MIRRLGLIACCLFLVSCFLFHQQENQPKDQSSTWVNPDTRLLFAKGKSPRIQGQSEAQGRLLTERAAHADAVRKLAGAIYGMQQNEEKIADPHGQEYSVVKEKVEGVILKAQRVDTPKHYPDGSIEITVAVSLDVIERALGKKLP